MFFSLWSIDEIFSKLMPRRKRGARASAQNIQIINQKKAKIKQNDSESIQVPYHPKKSQQSQPKQFQKTPLSHPTSEQIWTQI
jgi:hypothetical protein